MRHGPTLEIGHKAIARRITLYVISWLLELEKTIMLQTVSRLLPELPLFLVTAVTTHLVMSFAQTLMHYKLGHHPMGGKFFRNHINFHHAHYSKDYLVSPTYLSVTKATTRPSSSFLCFW